MSFNLQDFLDNPSVDKLDLSRKDDLLCIAAHFDITVHRNRVKKEIRREIVESLVGLKVFGSLTQPAAEPLADEVSVSGAGVASFQEDMEEQAAQATPLLTQTEGQARLATLPRFDPFSPEFHGSSMDAKLKVRLARLQLEAQEKELVHKADYDLRLQVRRLEIEADKEVRLKELEVEALKISSGHTLRVSDMSAPPQPASSHQHGFAVSKNISLVPTFRESEVDSYFCAFERIAGALNWPKDMWPILLHCKLVGKAQEVVSSLTLEDSLQYDVLKEAILRAYELVPEAYRQKFRHHKKGDGKTFVEFAREKGILFDKWGAANGVKDNFESLRQLIIGRF